MRTKDRNMMVEPKIPDDFFDEQGRHYVTFEEGETLKAGRRPAWLNGRFVVCMHELYSTFGETVDFARFVMSSRNVYRKRPVFECQYNRWPVIFNSKKAATEMLQEALPQFENWVGTKLDRDDPFKTVSKSRWNDSEWYPLFTLNNAATYRIESLRDVQRRLREKIARKSHHAPGESNGGYERRPANPNRSPRKAMKDVGDVEPVRYVLQDSVTERYVSIPPSGVRNAVLVPDVDDSTCFDTIDVLLSVGRAFDQSFFNPEFSKWRLKSVGVHVKDGRFTGFADIPYAMTHGTKGTQR